MPAVASVDAFLDVVRKSKVVDDSRLNAYLQQLSVTGSCPEDPRTMAAKMVRDGMISTFQAKQLLYGRWRRFVINKKFKLLELVGQGGMGSVYLCEHIMMRRPVALKVLPEEKLATPGTLQRFQREARAVAALDHPNIVHAYDMDRDEDLHFMVMEYVDGHSFETVITRFYKEVGMDITRAAHYIAQAAWGLQHAHEAGWVHRDIKPANILLDRQGVIKILDMGLSRLFHDDEEQLTRKFDGGAVLGTADYIAPEQALNVSGVDIRGDIYSLGATFYFLLTGRPPFYKGTVAQKLVYHQTREPESIRKLRPEIPPAMAEVVQTMMAKKPENRYATPADVAAALAPWTETPIPPPPESELPHQCPMVKDLLPTTVSAMPSGSRSSGSWRLSKPGAGAPPMFPVGSSPQPMHGGMMPGMPATQPGMPPMHYSPEPTVPLDYPLDEQHAVDTVVDRPPAQALTPRSLPRVVRPARRAAPNDPAKAKQDFIVKCVAIGASILILVAVIIVVWQFATDDPKAQRTARATGAASKTDSTAPSDPSTAASLKNVEYPVVSPDVAGDFIGRIVIVDINIKAVTSTANYYFLESKANAKDAGNLAIRVTKPMENNLKNSLQVSDLQSLVGKKLKAYGRVSRDTARYYIEVVNFRDIKIVAQ